MPPPSKFSGLRRSDSLGKLYPNPNAKGSTTPPSASPSSSHSSYAPAAAGGAAASSSNGALALDQDKHLFDSNDKSHVPNSTRLPLLGLTAAGTVLPSLLSLPPRVGILAVLVLAAAALTFGPGLLGGVPSLCWTPHSRAGAGLLGRGTTRWRAARLAVNYADSGFEAKQSASCNSLLGHGAQRCLPYNSSALDPSFWTRNQGTLNQSKGAGFWLWKPYIVLRTMLYEMEEGDLLLYADADSTAFRDLRPLYELAEENDIVIFGAPAAWRHREKQWTKPDAFVLMGCPVHECGHLLQVVSSFILWRKTFRSIQFVAQWLTYMEDARLSTDAKSTLSPDTLGFAEHRYDQSVLGLLAHRWNISAHNHSLVEEVFHHPRHKH